MGLSVHDRGGRIAVLCGAIFYRLPLARSGIARRRAQGIHIVGHRPWSLPVRNVGCFRVSRPNHRTPVDNAQPIMRDLLP